jgi:hypothetical protein
MDDDHFYAWRAEEGVKREAGTDLLAHIRAEGERRKARTEALLGLLTRGIDAELDNNPTEEDTDGRD